MLVHLKRSAPEFEGYPLECDVPEEQLAEMLSRGWYQEKKAEKLAEKKEEKPETKETKPEVKREAPNAGNGKKAD